MTLARRTTQSDEGHELEYYVYPEDAKTSRRVLVYVHGLISDVSWFQVPDELPEDTAILFVPRQPRSHVDDFAIWTRHYNRCLSDFKRAHSSEHYHLLAQCFGTMPAMHWATVLPNTFDTVTLASPPIELKEPFSPFKKLGIALGAKSGAVHSGLTPRSYGRSPALQKFVSSNPSTIWEFTNGFYRQTAKLRRWLDKNIISFPVPVHAIIPTEDSVALASSPQTQAGLKEYATRTTMICSDHFCEMLPTRKEFWRHVFAFQLEHEAKPEIKGKIKTVLVTGATGFLGSHVMRALHASGKHVIAYARSPSSAMEKFSDLTERFEVRQGDLDNVDLMAEAMKGVDAIVHTAGHVSDWDSNENFMRTNVDGTKNLLMLAHEAGLKQFVHISSLAVFGDIDQDHFDENHMYGLSSDFYSNSKIYAEIFVRRYCAANQIAYSIVRPGFIYGEGDNNFFPRLIENLKLGKAKYIGSRDNCLNTGYVGNVVRLVDAVIGNPKAFGQTYNIADRETTTIHWLFDRVCKAMDIEPPTKVIAKPVALGAATVMETIWRALGLKKAPPLTRKKVTFVARSRSVNAGKAWDLLGGTPYSREEGMDRTLAELTDKKPEQQEPAKAA